MMLRFPEFRALLPSDRGIFEEQAGCCSHSICDYTFANLMIWRDFDRPAFTFINGNLCIRKDPLVGAPFFLEPLGENDVPATVDACLRHTGRVAMASSRLVSKLGGNGFRVRPLPESFDYVYRTQELAELKGRRFDGKRNHIKGFRQRHPGAKFVRLRKEDAADALEIFDVWHASKRAAEAEGDRLPELAYACQRNSVRRAFESFDELGIMGGAVVIDGQMAGFIAGSALREEMACVHLCYGRPEFAGIFPALLWEACRETFSGFARINLEEDMGLVGLRRSKQSFHPLALEEKFEISAVHHGF